MKNLFYFLLVMLSMGLVGCNNANKTKSNDGKTKVDSTEVAQPVDLRQCDMAIFDKGKVTFFNSTTNTFVPFVAEKDYVVSGIYKGDAFYYTVAINDELYLKELCLGNGLTDPSTITGWELKLSDCYSKNCGKAATMYAEKATTEDNPNAVLLIGIEHGTFEDMCVFQGIMYYNCENKMKTDYWPAEYDNSQEIDAKEQVKADLGLYDLTKFDLNIPGEVEENKMEAYTVSPSRDRFAYAYYTDLGPTGGLGPLCFATLDGKVNKALEGTEVSDIYYGWLNDSRLVYSDKEGIKAVAADGTVTKISDGKMFVTMH